MPVGSKTATLGSTTKLEGSEDDACGLEPKVVALRLGNNVVGSKTTLVGSKTALQNGACGLENNACGLEHNF